MTQARVVGPTTGTELGLSDDWFISQVRDRLGDLPKWRNDTQTGNGVAGALGAGGVPFQVSSPKVLEGSATVRVSGAALTIDPTFPPAAGHVYVNYDTGELIFGTAPALNAPLSWDYQSVRWTDQDILDALMAGLKEMWPAAGKVYENEDTALSPLQWDYPLPQAACDYRSRILSVEWRSPNLTVLPWQPTSIWQRIGNTILNLPKAPDWFPGNLRLVYYGPYQRLQDLEPVAQFAPIWYALSALLPWKESERVQSDRAVAQTNEGGQQPGLLTQTGDYYYKRWVDLINELRGVSIGVRQGIVSTYDMRPTGGIG